MDYLPDLETLNVWIIHYGSFAFFSLLALGVIALPVPDETLMVFAGMFIRTGELPWLSTILAAYLGSMTGITVSYLIGRFTRYELLHRFGRYFGLTEAKLNVAHDWFLRYGKWTLSFGYFIPGIRHLTGIAAGISSLEYSQFALFAYTGAFIWASVFLSVGYFLGNFWDRIDELFAFVSDETVIGVLITLVALYLIYAFIRQQKKVKK